MAGFMLGWRVKEDVRSKLFKVLESHDEKINERRWSLDYRR